MNGMHGTLKPLHCACMVADADCVELLLQKGAEVTAPWGSAGPGTGCSAPFWGKTGGMKAL